MSLQLSRVRLIGIAMALVAFFSIGVQAEAIDANRYLDCARRFADTMLQYGTDRYGPRTSPMFVATLDPVTKSLPATLPPAPPGIRQDDRSYPGVNLYRDTMLIRSLYLLTRLTGAEVYRQGADAYLQDYVSRVPMQKPLYPGGEITGLLPWGEHMFWNVVTDHDQPWANYGRSKHELEHWTPLWAELYEFSPDLVGKAIDGLYKHHVVNKDRFLFNRHANIYTGQIREEPQAWIKHAGLYIYSFLFMYSKTNDSSYLDWARGLAGLYWNDRDPQTNRVYSVYKGEKGLPEGKRGSGLSLAYWIGKGIEFHKDEALYAQAIAYLDSFVQLGSISTAKWWDFAYGTDGGPAMDVQILISAFEATGNQRYLKAAQEAVAPLLITGPPSNDGIWAEAFGRTVSVFVKLYEHTLNPQYLDRARYFADMAIDSLFVDGLFLAMNGDTYRYYDNHMGVGDLVYALLQLAMAECAIPGIPNEY